MTIQRASWRAIGTNVDLLVTGGSIELARRAVEAEIAAADRAYSRFRPDSELSRLTAHRGRTVEVSPTLGEAIETGLRGAWLTDGLVDPTVGRALRLAGYDRDFDALVGRSDGAPIPVEAVPGWRAIGWDPERRRVRVPPGVELDFGSTGKALIVDRAAAAALAAAGPTAGVLLSIGGDIAITGPAPSSGWRILMAEDSTTEPSASGEVAVLRDGALATSSTRVRRWQRDGAELHHLIDPRSGRPAAGPWRTASVVAASCVDANIAATAAILLGFDAPAWLVAAGLPARLVATDGEIVRVGDWSPTAAPDREPRRPVAPSRVRQPDASRLAPTSPAS